MRKLRASNEHHHVNQARKNKFLDPGLEEKTRNKAHLQCKLIDILPDTNPQKELAAYSGGRSICLHLYYRNIPEDLE